MSEQRQNERRSKKGRPTPEDERATARAAVRKLQAEAHQYVNGQLYELNRANFCAHVSHFNPEAMELHELRAFCEIFEPALRAESPSVEYLQARLQALDVLRRGVHERREREAAEQNVIRLPIQHGGGD